MFKSTTTKPTVQVLDKCIPAIYINPDALVKMQLFVDGCDDEIGWLGTAYKNKDYILIDDVFLFDQDVHSTTTEITPEGLSNFAEELLKQSDGVEVWNNMKVWGHSHVRMSVSPSGQDNSQMETFSENGHDWFIRIIANKNGAMRVDLYEYTLGIIYNDLTWYEALSAEERKILRQIDELETQLDNLRKDRKKKFEEEIKKDIVKKVKKKSYAWSNQNQYGQTYIVKDGKIMNLNNTTNNTEDSGFKKKDEVKEIEEDDEDILISDLDIYRYLDNDTLLEIGECDSFKEIEEVLMVYGYANVFSKSDKQRIWQFGQRLVEKVYFS